MTDQTISASRHEIIEAKAEQYLMLTMEHRETTARLQRIEQELVNLRQESPGLRGMELYAGFGILLPHLSAVVTVDEEGHFSNVVHYAGARLP